MLQVFINFFAIINLTILAFLLWLRKDNSNSSKFLALVVISPASPFLLNYLIYIKFINDYAWLELTSLGYLWAPAVLFYIRAVLGKPFKRKQLWPHLILPFINFASWAYFISQGKEYTDNIFNNVFEGQFPWQFDVLNAAMFAQTLIYLSFSAYIIRDKASFVWKDFFKDITQLHQGTSGSKKTEQTERQKQWVRQFVAICIFINIVVIIMSLLIPREDLAFIFIPLFYNFIYFFIVYKSFKYSAIFAIAQNRNIKYSGSALSEVQSKEYYKRIIELISNEKLYLEAELKLDIIADKLDISANYISQAINQNEGKNFFEFINSYRIEEAKRLLKDPSRSELTIEAVAFDSGFGSKAAFNRTFKKYVGITPSEYSQQIL